MARVRAKRDVYLGEHGYRTAGEEFEYAGPENHHLEAVGEDSKVEEKGVKQGKGKK